ncbi:polygalacturonase-like [Hibiscus syriacus]|uniref:polygalacturonase-like n=1 Tax=Hibiscus syriacus TaxID=106335 RepID=UPI001921A1DC|nr:polygalacturonase-like [Hibiscus syriacus]XP_039063187.1 polygalacturonase-like [Hibiscus syriacus]
MAINFNVVCTMSIILNLFLVAMEAQAGALDVVAKFGAKADLNTNLSKPLLDAWKEACASPTPTTIVIPEGTYLLSQATLEGPCKAPIELQVQGNIKAPADPKGFKEPKWVSFLHVENFKLFGGGAFDGQGTAAYKREGFEKHDFCSNLPINIRLDFLTNAMIQDITIRDSKQFHANLLGCKNITLERVTVSTPKDSPNTDGIHIGRLDGVKIINTNIKTGDDCISIGDGSKNLDITGVTCGPGHGISIGSLGKFANEEPVEGIKVSNCTLTNTSNGVRIKTWAGQFPGTASDIHFEDITVKNVSCPVLIDQKYCPWNKCKMNEESNVKLSNISFKNIHGTAALPEVVKLVCSGAFPCENVELADIDITFNGPNGPAKSECKNVKPNITGKQNPAACSTPVPENPTPTV